MIAPNLLPVSYTHLDVYKRQLLERDDDALSIALLRVPYPLADLAAAVRAAGLPGGESWLADWRPGDVF